MDTLFQTIAIYGLALFTMGLSVGVRASMCPSSALQPRLFALACFGLLHGVYQWMMLAPAMGLPYGGTPEFRYSVVVVSFMALACFALDGFPSRRWAYGLAGLSVACWIVTAVAGDSPHVLEAATRFFIRLPAAACAAYALLFDPMLRPSTARGRNAATLAAAGFIIYAMLQIWSANGEVFPTSAFNAGNFASVFAVQPVAALALVALSITLGMLGMLDHFDTQTRRAYAERAETARAALTASEARLAEAQRIGKMGSWEWNVVTGELVWSDEIYRLFDIAREATPDYAGYMTAIHPDDRDRLQKEITAALFEGAHYNTRHRIVRTDGGVRIVDAQGEVEFAADGKPIKMFGICQDVTERVRLEEQSEEQRLLLRNVLDSMFAFVGLISMEGTLVDANRAAIEAFDRQPGDGTIGRPIWDTYHWRYSSESQARVREAFERAAAGAVVRGDYLIRVSDDRYLTIDAIFGPLRGRDGRVAQVIISAVDVTARKQAEEAVRASETRLRTILESEPECVKIIDRECRLIDLNAAGLRMIAATDFEQVAGLSVLPLIDPKYTEAFLATVAKVFAGQTTMQQFEIIALDGTRRWMEQHAAPLFDGSTPGKVNNLLAVTRDITERVLSEEAARRNSQRLEQAQRMANMGSWDWDIRTDVLTWSDQVYRIMGYDRHAVAPSRDSFLARVHPDDRERIEAAAREGLRSGAPFEFDHRIVLPDGEVRIAHELAEVQRDAEGKPHKIIGAIQDVTAQHAASEELVEAKLRAESANHAKSRFVASMSHELRTPLNAIIGFSELLMSDMPVTEGKRLEYAGDIHTSGKHLLSVINDILDISRIEAGKVALDEDVVAIADVVESCCRMARPKAEDGGVALHQNIEAGVTHIAGDRRLILQTVLNLVSNAVKFTGIGGRVDIDVRRTADCGVEIMVSDTGIGMSAEDVRRVGEPFLQIDGRHARKFEGTGLGLVIAKRLTELHGGQLGVESTLGVGTKMSIRLPASRIVARDEASQALAS